MLALRKRRLDAMASARRKTEKPTKRFKKSAVIVGAGLSGLSCAIELKRLGWSVLVVEASERVGGRCCTADLGGAMVDVGAGWIHGVRRNPLYELACRAGLHVFDTGSDVRLRYSDGSAVSREDDEVSERAFNEALTSARAIGENSVREEACGLEPCWWHGSELALGPVLDQALAGGEKSAKREVCAWHYSNLEYANGAPASALSLLHWDQDDTNAFDGTHCVVREGLGRIAALLARDVDVHFGFEARRIEYGGSSELRVLSRDGRVARADFVVLSVALGVLKSGELDFDPPLPAFKRRAIDELGFGTLDKTVVRFAERFWPHDALPLGIVDADRTFFLFIDLTPALGEPVVVALTPATQTEQHEARDARRCAEVFARALGLSSGRITSTKTTSWRNDPRIRGSYAYLRHGSTPNHVSALGAPLGGGRLRFCGEACSLGHLATATGAFLSGQAEARRLHRHYTTKPPASRDFFFCNDGARCALCAKSATDVSASVRSELARFDAGDMFKLANWTVHEGCISASPDVEVYDGEFFGVDAAVTRGRKIKCAACREPGATLGCTVKNCNRSFHIRCAAIASHFDFASWNYLDTGLPRGGYSTNDDPRALSDDDDDSDAEPEPTFFFCPEHRRPVRMVRQRPARPQHAPNRPRPPRRPPHATRSRLRSAAVLFQPSGDVVLNVRHPGIVRTHTSELPPFTVPHDPHAAPNFPEGPMRRADKYVERCLLRPRHVLLDSHRSP